MLSRPATFYPGAFCAYILPWIWTAVWECRQGEGTQLQTPFGEKDSSMDQDQGQWINLLLSEVTSCKLWLAVSSPIDFDMKRQWTRCSRMGPQSVYQYSAPWYQKFRITMHFWQHQYKQCQVSTWHSERAWPTWQIMTKQMQGSNWNT